MTTRPPARGGSRGRGYAHHVSQQETVLARPDRGAHIAQVHTCPERLTEAVGLFLGEGLRAGGAALVVARPAHREWFAAALARDGVDVAGAVARGQLTWLDAEATLRGLMVDDLPDRERFEAGVAAAVTGKLERWPEVRAYGEVVDLLWQDGRQAAALALEGLWNGLLARRPFALLCGYAIDPLSDASYGGPLERVCGVHSHLVHEPDARRLDQLVRAAGRELLDEQLGNLLHRFVATRAAETVMSTGQATLLWLMEHMPLTGERLLARVRAEMGRA